MSSVAFPDTADDVWWGVDEMATVAAVRRSAAAHAERLGFDADRVGEVGVVVSELATNLVVHARGGELVLRATGAGQDARLRVIAIDYGPGSRDIHALIADGFSSRGTLGIGLGACMRLSTEFDIYSVPAVGTVVEAVLGPVAGTAPREEPAVAHLTRPLSGEGPCGDAAASRSASGRALVMVADGLGHGPLAAEASRRAAEVFLASDATSPAAVLERMHAALGGTRGAAVSVLRYDASAGAVVHAGVGNVVTRLLGDRAMRMLPSQPGIVGHRMPRVREQSYPTDDMTAAVLHSDGLTQRWSLDDLPGVLQHPPAVICAAVLRGAASRRDDAGVLVLRTSG
jgi:anti-sigma regulatory factor (Ser/Thr protein kinase)